jgi:CheY-like chemotaxis protein/nitrogen-specific signal transduction histidine kinase
VFDASGRCVRMIGTAIDITARKAAEAAQREADKRKDEFIATLAHELRNPLAPLRNAVHILRGRGGTDANTARLYDMMNRQLGHLVRLVDDLLEMSRISLGTLELRTSVMQAADFIAAAREASEPLIHERHHTLEVQLPEQPVWVVGDVVRLAQLVNNLLNNAARYTEPGGRIRVVLAAEQAEAVIRVSDTGRGFTREEGERIFGLFARGEGSGGLGIGLALGRKLAEMHGGSLTAESAGPGRGATFTIRLPLAESPQSHVTEAVPGHAARPNAIRVLVVDDNVDAGDSMQMLLSHLGAEVTIARSGSEALRQFERVRPSLVLLDIGMPDIDGYEVARRLRTQFPEGGFQIVGLSGWGQERDRELGRAAGFDHHLVKPAEIGALQELLAKMGA